MNFRNTNSGILLRRWIARWFFWVIYIFQYFIIYAKLFFVNKEQPLVIVLTIGKVGSSSVYYNLKEQVTSRIFHIHYLSSNGIKASWEEHKLSSRKSVPLHLITCLILNKLLKKTNHKTYIITVFREPLKRKISSFFQNLDKYKEEISLKGLSFDPNKVGKILNDRYFLTNSNEEDIWIKNELINTFGFFVYQQSEIQKNDFVIEKKENSELLILKMENLNTSFSKAASKFLNLDKAIILKTYNDGEEKFYKKEYKKFNENFKIEEETLKTLCNTNYFTTFYSELESKNLKKWKKIK